MEMFPTRQRNSGISALNAVMKKPGIVLMEWKSRSGSIGL